MSTSQKLYYFCQVIGHTLLMSIALLTEFSNKPENKTTLEIITSPLIFTLSSWLAAHFVLRYIIKNRAGKKNSAVKTYFFSILLSAFVMAILVMSIRWLIQGPPSSSLLTLLLTKTLISAVLFSIWSLLYLAITSIRDKKRMARELKEQRLASLMNQINPHFLFNSLNTIRGMIFEDKDKSAELVTQLSTLFRYNLSTDTKAQTTLAEELEVCQHYLAIEDIRLGARLKVTFNICPDSKSAKIPTMGLLTLVENSIKHGISHLQQGGELIINSQLEQEQLIVTVSNPFNIERVKSGTQVGLKNLQQRIKLIFSEQGSISNTTDKDQFIATMTLPLLP